MEIEKRENNKQKAAFYFREKIECHIAKEPKGSGFINGYFLSELIEDLYYWFQDRIAPDIKKRLFLSDIHDIKDYRVRT